VQLPTKLQESLFQRVHFDPEFARHFEESEIICSAGGLQKFAAAWAEMGALGAFVAVPANQRRIRRWHRLCHFLDIRQI
jgi:hypothetical protein